MTWCAFLSMSPTTKRIAPFCHVQGTTQGALTSALSASSPEVPGMPLLDHFNPPLSRTHPWRSFHGAWAAAMARLLNQGILPAGYYAVPMVDRDGPIEVDVATLRESEAPVPASGSPAPWAPPAPG